MAKQLLVVAGPDKGRSFPLVPGDTLLVGRSQATQTRLTDGHVSRVHCEVQVEGEHILLLDSNSTGGTFVNGKRITQHHLRHGEVIQVGETHLRFQDDDGTEESTIAPPGETGTPLVLAELSGQTLSHYAIGSILARGQSGVVFKAEDTKDGRTVALKVLRPEFSKNEEEMQRFVRGMKTMLPLRHPNLIALYGAGKTGSYCWMAMEYIEGESLTKVIQRIGVAGMLDWQHALRVAVDIGRALDFAAQQQIIHRNIAPPNIMIQQSDKSAKLGDLMLAKALEGTLAEQITRPGEIVGDVQYMSPERTRGTTGIDGRADIYSLGATVYALLTGRPPCVGGTLVETITKIRQAAPEKPRKFQMSIPSQFEDAVMKMLEKRPEDRYQSAAALLTDLERVAKLQGVKV